jgi:predicted ATPase
MPAVFAQTWEHLTESEQALFKRLAVFKGGFQREAAESIAGASLPLLSSLLDKCLLRREAGGRYQIHELLRQYASDKLDHSEMETLREAHCLLLKLSEYEHRDRVRAVETWRLVQAARQQRARYVGQSLHRLVSAVRQRLNPQARPQPAKPDLANSHG